MSSLEQIIDTLLKGVGEPEHSRDEADVARHLPHFRNYWRWSGAAGPDLLAEDVKQVIDQMPEEQRTQLRITLGLDIPFTNASARRKAQYKGAGGTAGRAYDVVVVAKFLWRLLALEADGGGQPTVADSRALVVRDVDARFRYGYVESGAMVGVGIAAITATVVQRTRILVIPSVLPFVPWGPRWNVSITIGEEILGCESVGMYRRDFYESERAQNLVVAAERELSPGSIKLLCYFQVSGDETGIPPIAMPSTNRLAWPVAGSEERVELRLVEPVGVSVKGDTRAFMYGPNVQGNVALDITTQPTRDEGYQTQVVALKAPQAGITAVLQWDRLPQVPPATNGSPS